MKKEPMLKKAMIILFTLATQQGFSQTDFMDKGGSTALEKGHFAINAGSGYTNWGLPFYGGVEYAFNEDITCGGFVSYSTFNEDWFGYKWRHNVFSVFASANMHANRLLKFQDNVDLYAGFSLGFNSWSTSTSDNVPPGASYKGKYNSGLQVSAQAGARYYFNRVVGVQGELIVGSLVGMHAGLTFRIQ